MRGGVSRAGAAALVLVGCILVSSGRAAPGVDRAFLTVGYYVDYDRFSWQTLEAYGSRLHTVITTNVVVADASGRIEGTHDPRVAGLARRTGTRIHFRLSNDAGGSFSGGIAHAVLTDPQARARALAGTLAFLDRHGYDGVNLDLERVPPSDRQALTRFAADLAAAVRARGKTISIAVPGTTAARPDDPHTGAFDLAALARAVDWIIIMAYDEHWDGGRPGPVASLPWVESVVRFTKTQAPPQKLLLGVAFYGYDWSREGSGEGISMREAVRRAADARVPIRWDDRAKVPFYQTDTRTVYFENADSIALKVALARSQGLSGIAIWRLGHELPEVWDAMRRF